MRPAWLVVLAVLVACGAAPRREAKPAPIVTTAPDAGLADMTPAPGADVPSLDDLAKQAEPLLMHEVKRAGDVRQPIALPAAQVDTCFRANIGASRTVRAWFEDTTHTIRGEVAERTMSAAGTSANTLVPPRGPICAKKGDSLSLVVMAPNASTVTRAVIFASP